MYVPIAQLPDSINALNLRLLPVAWIVRGSADAHSLAPGIKEGLRRATGLPVTRVRSMDDVASQSIARTQLNMVLMTVFGAFALLLASIGIYALMAYSVQQRTREMESEWPSERKRTRSEIWSWFRACACHWQVFSSA